jgi:hypothetical protein
MEPENDIFIDCYGEKAERGIQELTETNYFISGFVGKIQDKMGHKVGIIGSMVYRKIVTQNPVMLLATTLDELTETYIT